MKNITILEFWAFLQVAQLVQADLISYNTLDGHNSGMMDALVGGGVTNNPTSTPTSKQLLNRYIQFELSNAKNEVKFSKKAARLHRFKEIMRTSHSIKLRNYLRTMKVKK